jgi:hypothetical protein
MTKKTMLINVHAKLYQWHQALYRHLQHKAQAMISIVPAKTHTTP